MDTLVSYDKLEVNQVLYEKKSDEGRDVHRAVIRVAPGPYGIVKTEWFMGRQGADSAIDTLRSVLNPTATR